MCPFLSFLRCGWQLLLCRYTEVGPLEARFILVSRHISQFGDRSLRLQLPSELWKIRNQMGFKSAFRVKVSLELCSTLFFLFLLDFNLCRSWCRQITGAVSFKLIGIFPLVPRGGVCCLSCLPAPGRRTEAHPDTAAGVPGRNSPLALPPLEAAPRWWPAGPRPPPETPPPGSLLLP